jgi:dihydrofolate reductase
MRISVIAAVDRNGLIGGQNGLPWKLPRDLQRFRELTWGKPIIMGRTTHEHIGRPLPGRHNMVLSRRMAFFPGCTRIASVEEAVQMAAEESEECFFIGGAEVYRQALPRADRIYLTVVNGVFEGTTFFPREILQSKEWTIVSREICQPDARNAYGHSFFVLEPRELHHGSFKRFAIAAALAQPLGGEDER